MKISGRLICTAIVLLGCSDNNDSFETKTNLLVDTDWWNSEIIGTPPIGYSVVSPLVFRRDKTAAIGGHQVTWEFIENGRSIQIIFSNANTTHKYEIINLTDSELHFKEYSGADFLIELKYNKCPMGTPNPC